MGILTQLFGTTSQREIKKIMPLVEKTKSLSEIYNKLSDYELREKTAEFKGRIQNGESLDSILPEAFANVREASRRVTGMYPFEVQLIGGILLHQGRIAEMKTGEGKTLVAVLPSYLNALSGKAVHVITVNDYLATRDAADMGRIHKFLGLSVGVITHDTPIEDRKLVYSKDIVYGTNNEFGFDYLRDNMAVDKNKMVQRDLSFAIVDEVDSILIDEARTPLIISGPSSESSDMYLKADKLVRTLECNKVEEIPEKTSSDDFAGDYIVDEKHHSVVITQSGYDKIEQFFNIENCADMENSPIIHHVTQAMRAHSQMEKDKDYIIEDGQIIIVDEFTGRLMYGRRYNNGLHQAIEAKEHIKIARENITLATITFQNYFRMYGKLSGMTGTAKTEEDEFREIYGMDVIEVPTNMPMVRDDHPDKVYLTRDEKLSAIINQIVECNKKGQPVLVGTVSIEKSEELSKLLKKTGIKHHVLNAKNHKQEAEIIAQAGRLGAVTIATNMAGRGTDVILGGNPVFKAKTHFNQNIKEFSDTLDKLELEELGDATYDNITGYMGTSSKILKFKEDVLIEKNKLIDECNENKAAVIEAGGLYILGTERHESRRIDNQLRGRSGRQGDIGESCFFLSLDDDLLRIFGGDKVKVIASAGGIAKGQPLEMKILSSVIEKAQKNLEGINFQSRKTLIQFDDVINKQREIIYKERRDAIMCENVHNEIIGMLRSHVLNCVNFYSDVESMTAEDKVMKAVYENPFGISTDYKDPMELIDIAEKVYETKIGKLPKQLIYDFEKRVLLSNVDKHWIDHIDAMKELQTGIGLRGYGQLDPVVEYRNEGSKMFEDMVGMIRNDTAEMLMLVTIKIEPNVKKA